MDITIDDTSPDFVWGAGDVWRAQAPNQGSINSNYFLSTYHAAQTKGANVSITFVGSACQIYGSTGPNHGNYSVTFDNAVKFSPGFSAQSQYRQLLFSHSFGNTFDTHTVVLRNEEDFWLDLDFMVLTINTTANTATSDIGFFATTVTGATAVPPGSASTDSADSSSGSSSSNLAIFRTITFVLAALLGVLILAFLFWFFVYRRRTAGRANSNANGGQDFQFGHKVGASATLDVRSQQGEIKDSNSGRQSSSLLGYGRTKFGKGTGIEDASLMQTPTSASQTAMGDHDPLPFSRNSTLANSVVGGAARDTLIALNNMGKRPGYRNLGSEGESHSGSRSSVAVPNPLETTPTTSVRTLGSAGQTWIKNDPESRFKGKVGPGSLSRLSSVDSDMNLSNMSSGAHLLSGRNAHNRINSVQSGQRVDEEYASVGIGLGIYSNSRADQEQRRADLRRSASVASSGIIDRLASSPPPAVPELPPMSTTSSIMSRGVPSHTFSPTESAYSQSEAYGGSVLGLATRVKPSYTNINANAGALRLQPPPIRGVQEERERERTQRERERLEKEREAIREREENERAQQEVPRYSRPPPEYMPTPTANQIPPMPTQGADLQRQGTRTGDIPIGIEGGFGYEEAESQDSHSVAHAFVQTALHVPVPPQQRQQIIAQQTQALSSQTTVNSYSQHSTTTIPAASSKRPFTPERSYNPNQTMAIPGERGPVGRSSEDKVWTLDGPNATSTQRGQGVGMPIMDDRARLAAVSPIGVKKVTRVPSPQP